VLTGWGALQTGMPLPVGLIPDCTMCDIFTGAQCHLHSPHCWEWSLCSGHAAAGSAKAYTHHHTGHFCAAEGLVELFPFEMDAGLWFFHRLLSY
jgi:hypothetical protein